MTPTTEAPRHCDLCGLEPLNRQLYPLRMIDGEWTCSRHPELYSRKAVYPCVGECCRGKEPEPRVTKDPFLDGGE